jgi:hypothetical protein
VKRPRSALRIRESVEKDTSDRIINRLGRK